MKNLITALLVAVSAVPATAVAKTYTFDLYTTANAFPPAAPVNAGSGTISFAEQTMATAKTNQPGFSIYEPVTFDLKFDFTNWAWTDRDLTIGRVNVGHQLTSVQCIPNPPNGCLPGAVTVSNSIAVDFIGGTFNVRSPDVLSDGNLSQANIDRVFSNATGGNMTLVQTSPYGVPSGPVYLQLTNIRALPVAAPVPEPGEWAMMAAGLGIVGAVAKRRRRTV